MPTLFLLRGGHTALVKSKTPEEIRDALPKFKGKDFLGFEEGAGHLHQGQRHRRVRVDIG